MKKNSIAFSYILVFLMIYLSSSTFLFDASPLPNYIKYILPIFIEILLLGYIIVKCKIKITATKIFAFLLISYFLVIMMLINHDFSLNNFYEVVILFTGMLVTYVVSEVRFKRTFINVMFVLSLFSLIVYVLTMINPGFLNVFPIVKNNSDFDVYFLGIAVVPCSKDMQIRNFGIFREPGVFICFICMALLIGKSRKRFGKVKKIVFYLTILTTLSTTGYLVMIVLIFMDIFEKKSIKLFVGISISILVAFIILKVNTNLLDLDGPVFAKILVKSGSYGARVESIIQNFQLIEKYGFFGAGWENSKLFFLNSKNEHNTNTIMFYFSCYGIVPGIIYTLGILSFFRIKKRTFITLLSYAALMMTLIGERICFDPSMVVIIFYGLSKALTTKTKRTCVKYKKISDILKERRITYENSMALQQ